HPRTAGGGGGGGVAGGGGGGRPRGPPPAVTARMASPKRTAPRTSPRPRRRLRTASMMTPASKARRTTSGRRSACSASRRAGMTSKYTGRPRVARRSHPPGHVGAVGQHPGPGRLPVAGARRRPFRSGRLQLLQVEAERLRVEPTEPARVVGGGRRLRPPRRYGVQPEQPAVRVEVDAGHPRQRRRRVVVRDEGALPLARN